jgi:hypothetical protein
LVGVVLGWARDVVSGDVDPYAGGSDIWRTALILHDRPEWSAPLPFAELTDTLEQEDLAPDTIEHG